ncbi:MAG: DEAD/DEAH box helicase [Rhodanobacteraceae bacterium]|jgi:superfamily II DNA or RNA helicase|nr:DEAD/DEAH box helicase [Rhodanobacteraceae bacterium]
MDETTFRQLLARHWAHLFDKRTIDKGAAYLNAGRVLGTHYESGDGEGALIGMVKGSARDPYAAGVRLEWDGRNARLDSYCTCPLEFECKHVAATVLYVLRDTANAPHRDLEPPKPQLGAWKNWLDGLRAPAPAASGTLVEPDAVAAIVLRPDEALLPTLLAQAVRVRPGKRGGFVAPRPLEPAWGDPAPWRGLDAATFQLVAGLRMRRHSYGPGGSWFRLADAADAALLETLLATLPCFYEKPSAGRLALGPVRALRIGWDAREDGTQKLALSIDAASPSTHLLQVGGLWYLDPVARELGRVDGDARLAEAVRRAPPLLPEQVPLLLERWKDAPLLAALPIPAVAEVERREVKPVPVLTLRAIPALGPGAIRHQIGCMRLGFDYGGVRLPLAPAAPRERRRQGERVVEIVRDRASEVAACERLDSVGLVPAELLGRLPGAPRDAFDDSDLVLEHGRGQLAGTEQVFALTPRLRDLGFRLESADGFPFDLLDEPDDWFAEVDEDAGNPWFDLRLGIDIGGERIDLLPILHRLLADPLFPLNPRKGEPDDAVWLVPIDARRRVPLPLAKLRELIAPLLEWLQGPLAEHDGALRLRRAQADVVERLAQEANLPWRGGERLRAEFERLRAPREPAREPAGFRATLRGYQRDGLAWLGFLADAGLGGILADDMGLGKTVQVLAHLLAEKQRGRLAQPALVLAPTSLVGNWRDEAARFAPDLSVLVVHGPERAGLHADIPRHDLVITTYPLLLRDRDALVAHEYSVLVLDEAQAIKNAKSQAARIVRELAARQRLAMTGTPLENHLGELWAQFDAVEPGLLGNDKHFTRFFRTPIEKHADAERRERLQRRIAPLLLRRRKEDVLTELPPKTEIARQIELEGDQRALYETLRLAQHERVLAEVKKRGLAQSGIVVLDALLKLRQACCDPRLVKLDGARRVKESAKLDYLLDLLASLVDEGRRVLVFSQFAEMLALIGQALDARSLAWQTLTGDTPGTQRAALVKRFQDGHVPLFLISLKAGGVGLNLTAADTVIHYDPWWNPAVEAQATDRAHRIGQDKPVFVYKLICAGTVEEKIQALQQRKAELAQAVLDGGSTQAARFDETDLAELFAPL